MDWGKGSLGKLIIIEIIKFKVRDVHYLESPAGKWSLVQIMSARMVPR